MDGVDVVPDGRDRCLRDQFEERHVSLARRQREKRVSLGDRRQLETPSRSRKGRTLGFKIRSNVHGVSIATTLPARR